MVQSLSNLLANPEFVWLAGHIGEEVCILDDQGDLVAGAMIDGPVAPIVQGGEVFGHVQGEQAEALARVLSALLRETATDVTSEEEFREITLALASELQLRPLLQKIMKATTRLLGADRSTLFLNDVQSQQLWTPVAQGLDGQEIRFPNDTGIAGTVFTTKKSINIEDAYSDPRFNRDTDKMTGYTTTSILCCPVVNKQGHAIGAIQALNKHGGPFEQRDADRLSAFAAQVSMAIENAQLYHNLEEKVRERTKDLNETLEQLSNELDQAGEYVQRLIPDAFHDECLSTLGKFIPSATLGGDAFGYHWLDEDHFAVYLTDVSGHGVGAALLSVSITNVLRAHALPGVDFCNPGEVLSGLNKTFPMADHNNMFFTIWYGVYNKKTSVLTYASGGHPPALLFSGGSTEQLRTPNPLMGGIPDVKYEVAEIRVGRGDRLVVYSDGCYEVEQRDESMWTLEEFVQFMSGQEGAEGLDTLLVYVRQLGGSHDLEDDFSILELRFG